MLILPDVGAITATDGHTVYRYSSDEKAVVDPPSSDIEKVQGARAGTNKRAVVTMRDSERFVSVYGMLIVKKLAAAIDSISTA